MKPIIQLYATLRSLVADRAERLRDNSDEGATIFEYAALLVLVGTLIAALYSMGIVGKFDSAVSSAVSQLLSGKPN